MKKTLNWIISVAGFLLLIGLLLISLNNHLHFMDDIILKAPNLINYLVNYGALTIVGAMVFVNVVGKGIIRIIFLIIFLLVLGFYVFSSAFPGDFVKLFGIM